jgi:hypothetical protein
MLRPADSQITKSIVKFIDLVLDLYSPVASDLCNQMRNLQSTLLYGRMGELETLITGLEDKLELKSKHKHSLRNSNEIKTGSVIKSHRAFNDNDSEKENTFGLSNRINTCANVKNYENCLSVPNENRSRTVSVTELSDKSFEYNKENVMNRHRALNRNSSRTLLKIVKKNRSSK